MQQTRPETGKTFDPQEEEITDIVAILHNEIQMVGNVIKEALNEDEKEIYFFKRENERLMQPDPMVPEKRLKQRIAENNAEMKPLIADVANINSIQDRFEQVVRDACEKTKIEVITRNEESKEEQI